MSSAVGWNSTVPDSPIQREPKEHPQSCWRDGLWCCLADAKNVPRYLVRYGILALALLGAIQLLAVRGDGPMPVFVALSPSANLDPQCVSSARCLLSSTSDRQRWEGLAPALAILGHTNPVVAQWVENNYQEGRLVFVDGNEVFKGDVNFLAKYDRFQRELKISPGLYAEPDGSVAAILCHEYRHSRQCFPKFVSYALSFLFLEGGDPMMVENEAVIYEQEARCAIFGESNEPLDALTAQLATR